MWRRLLIKELGIIGVEYGLFIKIWDSIDIFLKFLSEFITKLHKRKENYIKSYNLSLQLKNIVYQVHEE